MKFLNRQFFIPTNFSFAFQPIVNVQTGTVFGYEALIRTRNNGTAHEALRDIPARVRPRHDVTHRSRAIEWAVRHQIDSYLSLNIYPNALASRKTGIGQTIDAAQRAGFPTRHLMFELLESEALANALQFKHCIAELRDDGFLIAIDDFGSGYSGLKLLTEIEPDFIKLDACLTQGVAHCATRRRVASSVVRLCHDLGVRVIAESVEDEQDFGVFFDLGVEYFQGYLFGRPAFERFPASAMSGPTRDPCLSACPFASLATAA